MQGRLLPKYKGRYQAHPLGYWQDEFLKASELGLDCIEFILDFNDVNLNPLIYKNGLAEIKSLVNQTGVEVKTICADYFMEAPLHSKNIDTAKFSKNILINLLNQSAELGLTDIVIPCVDQSSLDTSEAKNRFISMLMQVIEIAELNKVNLSLETDLPPKPFLKLIKSFDSNIVTVNYDIGNSAALGFDPIEEIETYGDRITDIHIKDRVLGGSSVVLGDGDANFKIFFTKLKDVNYQGPFIMQAYRDEEGVEIFKHQLEWIAPYLDD
jgi:L-ribulose-5-phosphate 3-epimerase